MATPFLSYMPVRDSYTFTPAYNVRETKLDGGPSRKRLDFLGGTHTITPTWILDKGNYTAFMAFFRERVQYGSRLFRMNLLSDFAFVMPHLCTPIGGLPKLAQQSGDAYFVSGAFEVVPNPTKTHSLFLNNVTSPRLIDAGTVDYAGELLEFPVGRSVLLTGTTYTDDGLTINLDGTYTIDSAPNDFTRLLLNAAVVNPDWTVLNTLIPQQYNPLLGAAVLVPL